MRNLRTIMNTAVVSMLCFIIAMSVVTPAMVASAAGDVTAPITNASVSGTIGANGWYVTNASVNLTATDDMSGVANISYNLDNNGWINYTGNLTITDGKHFLQYNSTDNDSNKEANVSHKLFINVDTVAPHTTLSISGTSTNGWYFSPVTVSLTASDSTSLPAITWYNLNDNTGWKQYSGSFSLSSNSYTVSYYSVDNAGNLEGPQSTHININPGTFKPVTAASLSGTKDASGWYVSNVAVTFTATGGTGGINHTEYSFNNKTWITGNSLVVTAEGWTGIFFRSVDNAGDIEDVGTNNIVWVPIDKFGPVISCSLSGDRNAGTGWYNGDVTVTLTASDNGGSGINLTQYSLDGAHWVNYTAPFKFGWGPSRTFFYRATDNLSRNTFGSQFVYFRPQNMDEGPMSDMIYYYGYGPSLSYPTATPSPTPRPTITPTPAPEPTSTPLPSATGPSPTGPAPAGGTSTGLALGVLLVVLAMLAAGCIALYYLVFKPK